MGGGGELKSVEREPKNGGGSKQKGMGRGGWSKQNQRGGGADRDLLGMEQTKSEGGGGGGGRDLCKRQSEQSPTVCINYVS